MSDLSTLYKDLYDVAVADVKGAKIANADLEDLQGNPDIWYDSLIELKREVELQLADKKRELHQKSIEYSGDQDSFVAYQNDYNIWRVKVLRFLISIESKLRYVKRLRTQAYEGE